MLQVVAANRGLGKLPLQLPDPRLSSSRQPRSDRERACYVPGSPGSSDRRGQGLRAETMLFANRARLRPSSSLQVLDQLLELRGSLSDFSDSRSDFLNALGGRTLNKVWIAELPLELRSFSTNLLLLAFEPLNLLLEIDKSLEWHGQLGTTNQHGTSRSFWRDEL